MQLPVLVAPRAGGKYKHAAPRIQKRVRQVAAAISPTGLPSNMNWTSGIKPESLTLAVAYLGRLVASLDAKRDGEAASIFAEQAPLHFATCVVLADKFSNDRSYNNLLLLVADAAGLDAAALRRAEVATLSALLDTSGMCVSFDEFEDVAHAIDVTQWGKIGERRALSLLARIAHRHADVLPAGAVVRPLISAGAELQGRRSHISGAMQALGSIIGRVHAPRTTPPARTDESAQSSDSGSDSDSFKSTGSAASDAKASSLPRLPGWMQRMRGDAPSRPKRASYADSVAPKVVPQPRGAGAEPRRSHGGQQSRSARWAVMPSLGRASVA